MFAKVQSGILIKYPYDLNDLRAENPFTIFDIITDLPTLYSRTEEAAVSGAQLVEVVCASDPAYDPGTQVVIPASAPTLIDGIWVLGNSITQLTQSGIDALALHTNP